MICNWICLWYIVILGPFNFVDLCWIKLLDKEISDHLDVCIFEECLQIIYLMLKQDLALNNQQRLICYKTKPNKTKQRERERERERERGREGEIDRDGEKD